MCSLCSGQKAVPGDLFSGAVSLELVRTSGAQLTGTGSQASSRGSICHEVMGPDAMILGS